MCNKSIGAQQQLKADDNPVPDLARIRLSCFVPTVVRAMDNPVHRGMENLIQLQLMVQTLEDRNRTFPSGGVVIGGRRGIKLFVNEVNQIEGAAEPEKNVEVAQHSGCVGGSAVALLN